MSVECIDAFCHCLTPRYCAEVAKILRKPLLMFERAQRIKVMIDLEARLKVMDQFPGYRQVVCLASPPVELLAPSHSAELARIANDEMARMVDESDRRVCGFVATLPLNNVAASIEEATRAIESLGAVGVQFFTNVCGTPLDAPEFRPLWEHLHVLDRPILLHPLRSRTVPDYPGEDYSKFDLWWAIGWPYETTLAMCRLALAGIFERLPRLKIVAHHVGGFIPMLSGRLGPGMELLGTRNPPGTDVTENWPLKESLVQACSRFYADTASFGSLEAIECGKAFFGSEQLLFATDMPFDPGQGPDYIRSTLSAIEAMNLSDDERQAILVGNACRLFHLEFC